MVILGGIVVYIYSIPHFQRHPDRIQHRYDPNCSIVTFTIQAGTTHVWP